VLFEQYSERLLSYFQRRLGSPSDAEDAMQTTFLQAHRALERGVVPASESAWLFTIARNVCRWHKRTVARRAPVAADVDVEWLTSPSASTEEEIDLARDLDEALASIPERQRQAFVLREWRGLSCEEIAARLELSSEATHSLLTRARRSVASALSAAGRRPVLGLDFGGFVAHFRALLAGSSAKVAVGVVAVAGSGVVGVVVERGFSRSDRDTPPIARSSTQPWKTGVGADTTIARAVRVPATLGRVATTRAPLGAAAPTRSPGATESPLPSPSAVPSPTTGQVTTPAIAADEKTTPQPVAEKPLQTVGETVGELLQLPATPEVEATVEVPSVAVPPVAPGVEVETPGATVNVTVPDVSDSGAAGLLP
jgi:RNA polymerase sigma-70 factor (ECF subfamily)